MTSITKIQTLPYSPFNDTGVAGIAITNGVFNYFRIAGSELNRILSINWYPKNPSSVQFTTRQIILVDDTEGTFMIHIIDNFLDVTDRAGHFSFRLDDGTTISFPTKTYGPVNGQPLWRPASEGLITG